MELVLKNTPFNASRLEVIVCHKGEEVYWNIATLAKIFLETKIKFDMFEQINSYWAQLPEKDQDEIFKLYVNIRAIFDEDYDRNQLTKKLYSLIAKLVDKHDLADAEHWIKYHSKITLPDVTVFKAEYIVNADKPGTREQTYLRDDYIKLITMSMVLRTLVPIWGEFISRTKSEAGTQWKEFYAFRLLNSSKLMTCEAMQKLKVYVEFSTVAGKNKASSILSGVSSEDFPMWILGLVVTRKVCVGDIRGIDPNTHLITYIYSYINQRVTSVDTNFNGPSGAIKDKNFEEQSEAGEKNTSRLEGYKAKQEIPHGDIISLEHSVRDVYALALKLAPTMDTKLLVSALKTTDVLNRNFITEPQITLLQYILKPVVSTRGILYLSKTTIVRLLALTQAVLWHRGHKDLAGLSTATSGQTSNDLQISGVDSRARIPKELVDEFNILYPHSKRPSGKQKTIKLLNPAIIAIDSLTENFSSFEWTFTLEEKYVREINGNSSQRRYAIPHNIKILIAQLALQLAKRNY